MTQTQKITQAAIFNLKAIKAHKVVNYGTDAPDYFPGLSAIGTTFDEVITGIGETPAEAYEDALGQLSEVADTAYMPTKIKGIRKTDSLTDEEADSNFMFFVGIYYSLF